MGTADSHLGPLKIPKGGERQAQMFIENRRPSRAPRGRRRKKGYICRGSMDPLQWIWNN